MPPNSSAQLVHADASTRPPPGLHPWVAAFGGAAIQTWVMSLTNALIVLAIVVFVIVRRLIGEPLEARKLVTLPLLLIALGVWQFTRIDTGKDLHHLPLDTALLAFGALIALAGGIVRGFTIRVYVRNGHLWSRYTWATLGVWVILLVVRVAQTYFDAMLGADTGLLTAALGPMLALSLIGEAVVVARASFRSGAPFAPRSARRTTLRVPTVRIGTPRISTSSRRSERRQSRR